MIYVFICKKNVLGNLCDADLPIKFLCRCLCRKFLLLTNDQDSDQQNPVAPPFSYCIPDKDVRVSQKVLALTCVTRLISFWPDLMNESMITNGFIVIFWKYVLIDWSLTVTFRKWSTNKLLIELFQSCRSFTSRWKLEFSFSFLEMSITAKNRLWWYFWEKT